MQIFLLTQYLSAQKGLFSESWAGCRLSTWADCVAADGRNATQLWLPVPPAARVTFHVVSEWMEQLLDRKNRTNTLNTSPSLRAETLLTRHGEGDSCTDKCVVFAGKLLFSMTQIQILLECLSFFPSFLSKSKFFSCHKVSELLICFFFQGTFIFWKWTLCHFIPEAVSQRFLAWTRTAAIQTASAQHR